MTKFKTFFKDFAEKTQDKITQLARTNLANETKKQVLDEYITNWATAALNNLHLNMVIKWFITKYFLGNIGVITQIIFDLLNAKVDELNKRNEV